ncbi:inositol monophosphatase family protein [Aneurinibacillus terranovensis]|uniref:inositol monophosphatase family protein n=1 Tax=Aneurinibacillus terranovensis TaxID=278991 RepID=UPI000418189C|nr:inositol monophosphatase [Aneurinibacillus terranovensis]
MQISEKKEWGSFAKRCAREAGALIQRMLEKPLEVMYKSSAADLVTSVDRAVEKYIMDSILNVYPGHGILGEEGLFARDVTGYDAVWVIDPIDGTTNFVHQKLNYCISIAFFYQGICQAAVVYDPTRDEMFYAEKDGGAYLNDVRLKPPHHLHMEESLLASSIFWNKKAIDCGLAEKIQELAQCSRGMRVLGVAALELAYVAAGRLDGYVSMSLNSWDYAAGKLLIEEAGGIVTRMDGTSIPFTEKTSILAANPGIHQKMLEFIKEDRV